VINLPIDFAQISSTKDQRPSTTSPVAVTMNHNDEINGIEHNLDKPADIKILYSAVYVVVAAPQIGRTSGNEPRYIDFWYRKNDRDVPNSTVRAVLKDSTEKDVLVNQSMMTLSDGDILNIMMCVETGEEGLGIETLFPNSRPVIPSIIVSLLKISEINSGGHWVTTGKGTGRIWVK
jgi:hypothetical protein